MLEWFAQNWLVISIFVGAGLAAAKLAVSAWKQYAATTPSLEDDAAAAKAEEIVNKVESVVDKAKGIVTPKPKV